MNYTDVTILHTNDLHSYVENFPKKARMMEDIRAENQKKGIKTFYFDSGDLFSGNIVFTMYRGVKEIELMNQLGCQAMTLGNHEFDHGDELLSRLEDFARFPIVSSNLRYRDVEEADELVPLSEYLEFDMEGRPLYVFGLTTLDTQEVASPSDQVLFEDPYQSLRRMVDQIGARTPQAQIVLLSHLGYDEDQQLAQVFPEVNVILGGHSHTVLREPTQVGKVSICQTGQYGRFVGHLSLRCYEDGSHEVLSYELIDVDALEEENPAVRQVIYQMKAEQEALFSQPIANLPTYLDGTRETIAKGQSTLAPLITQAFFEAALAAGFRADGAVLNGFGIRASLGPGPVSYTDIVKVLPFSKRVVLVAIKGRDLLASLKTGQHPQLWRLALEGETVLVNGRAVEEEQVYHIVTNSFVWSGKDNYDQFLQADIVADLGLDVEIFRDFLKKK